MTFNFVAERLSLFERSGLKLVDKLESVRRDIGFAGGDMCGGEIESSLGGDGINELESLEFRRKGLRGGRWEREEGRGGELSETTAFIARDAGMRFNFMDSDLRFRDKEGVIIK